MSVFYLVGLKIWVLFKITLPLSALSEKVQPKSPLPGSTDEAHVTAQLS